MSQYGYGYGPPQGRQPAQAYPYQSQPFLNLASYPSTESINAGNDGPSVISQESYEYNRNAIPGLALGFANNASWQQGWAPPSGQQSESLQPISANQNAIGAGDTNQQLSKTQDNAMPVGDDDEAMEEGELSEGELEDIYEPKEVPEAPRSRQQHITDHAAPSVHTGRASTAANAQHAPHSHVKEVYTSSTQPWEASHVARERSGSYSPYLSPREMQFSSQSNSAQELDDTPRSGSAHSILKTALPNHLSGPASRGLETTQASPVVSPGETLMNAKKQAQQAILRLWPLNIGYQSFVDEGVDKSVLSDLLTELGLETKTVVQGPATPIDRSDIQTTIPATASLRTSEENIAGGAQVGPEHVKKPKDKSEERKDRIARLLAAKGSKAAAAAPEASTMNGAMNGAKAPLPATTSVPPTKPQSEKSKLLQQKMEALKKAREAHAKMLAQQSEASNSTADPPNPGVSATSDNPVADIAASSEVPPTVEASAQSQIIPEKEDVHGPQSIPGLFLSSTPQPSHSVNPRKRPVAADLNESSVANTYKRPFGQIRESRPFLIDVSDDEDDAEMEIDSPEQRSPLLHRPTTPPPRTTSFRDHPVLSDNGLSRQFSSPSAAATPTGQSGGANGLYDLESMNKKIEDMKRKIAEAEARKKAKQSNNGTPSVLPSVPPSQQQSKEGSADPSVVARPISTRAETEDNRSSASLLGQTTFHINQQRSPQITGQKLQTRLRARSRVASERLPLVEARRKEQLARLHDLQSEVARIEREIEDSITEEKRLREEAMESEEAGSALEDSGDPDRTSPNAGSTEPESSDAQNGLTDEDGDLVSAVKPHTTPPLTANLIATSSAAVDQDSQSQEESQDDLMDIVTPADEPTPEAQSSSHKELENATVPSQPLQQREDVDEEEAVDQSNDTSDVTNTSPTQIEDPLLQDGADLSSDAAEDEDEEEDEDVAMEEGDDTSSDEDSSESSDEYEPAEAVVDSPSRSSGQLSSPSSIPIDESTVLETTDTDVQGVATRSPVTEPISIAKEDSVPGHQEVEMGREPSGSPDSKSTFVPYQTPLQYFRAYRFHPNFNDTVGGGLRSLTYSNMLDVKREVCPDQLAGAECPRGNTCEYQHLDRIKAPDDQILLQLGAYGNYEGEQKQQYINGLRELLTDFRDRDVKDFQAISQGIIEYRAQFHGDRTKILPLGNVSI